MFNSNGFGYAIFWSGVKELTPELVLTVSILNTDNIYKKYYLTLSEFIVMMRELEVHSSGVDVQGLAADLGGHG